MEVHVDGKDENVYGVGGGGAGVDARLWEGGTRCPELENTSN